MMYPPQGPPQIVSPQVPHQFATPQGPHTSLNMPAADYQLLDERIRVLEWFSTYGMDAKELCLVLNVVLPHKFKFPDPHKYKGLIFPKSHITMYCRKMTSYIDNDAFLIYCFQDSLFGGSLDWYMGLECIKIRSWKYIFDAFLK